MTIQWTPLGPSVQAKSYATGNPPVSGRVMGIVVGPGGARAYLGTVDGGVWFSADTGATWTPLLDGEIAAPVFPLDSDAEAVACLDVRFGASAATDTVVVATGASGNVGIRYSSQGGAPGTWLTETTGFQLGSQISRILIDPDNAAIVYMASANGLFKRTAANTWQAAPNPSSGGYTDIAIAGKGATKQFYVGYPNGKIFVAANFSTWTAVPSSAVAAANRVILAVAESNPAIVYALDDNAALRRLTGGTFQTIAGVPKAALLPGNQGVGDMILAVDPTDADTLYLGGDETNTIEAALFKGKLDPTTHAFPFNAANTGAPQNDATWIGKGIHADVHSFGFALNAANTAHVATDVWCGNDGGIWQSTSSGANGTFTPHNTGLATLFLNQTAQRADLDSVLLGAGNDNGMFRMFGEQAALQIGGGDGGGVAIDQNDGYRVMTCGNGLGITRSIDGGYTWMFGNFPPAGDAGEASNVFSEGTAMFTSPAGGATVVCVGTNRVWMSTAWGDPGTWVTLPGGANPYLQPAPQKYTIDALDGFIYSIAVVTDALLFAATNQSVYRFDRTGTTWTQTKLAMTGIPAATTISCVAVDDAVVGSVYVTLGIFGGGGHDHVWRCAGSGQGNPGTGFTSVMAHSILDCPVNAIVLDPKSPQTLYIGTQVGVWKRDAGTWSAFSTGLPESAIVGNGLAIHAQARLLRATTVGRGVWEYPIDATGTGTDPDIFLRINYADSGRLVGGSRYPWVDGAPDPTAKGFKAYHWMSADIKVFRDSLGLTPPPNQADYVDFAFNIGDWIDSQTHIETADANSHDRIFVEVHNRGATAVAAQQVRVCVLVTECGAALPALPAGYAAGIQAGTTSWLPSNSPWKFVDPITPFRLTPGALDVRTPQVVSYDNIDFTQFGFASGDHVCAAAFITTVNPLVDPLTSTISSLDQLTMQDKHVAHRNLHLVAAGARPLRREQWQQASESFLIDFHNPGTEAIEAELVFDRTHFPGEVAVMLPRLHAATPSGFTVIEHTAIDVAVREHIGAFFERIGARLERVGEAIETAGAAMIGNPKVHEVVERRRHKIESIDRSRVFVAAAEAPAIHGVRIEPHHPVTAVVTVKPPAHAPPGTRFRLDIVQRQGGRIAGGSSFVIAVVKA